MTSNADVSPFCTKSENRQRLHDLWWKRGRRGPDQAQSPVVDLPLVAAGSREDGLVHGGHGRVPGRVGLFHRGEERQRVEPWRAPDRRSGRERGEHGRRQPMDVKQRHDVQTTVVRYE